MKNFQPKRWITAAIAFALMVCMAPQVIASGDEMPMLTIEKFKSAYGNFSIDFPGAPTISDELLETEIGDVTMRTYMYERSFTEAFMVAITDFPSAYVYGSDENELLEGAKGGAFESLEITALDEEEDIQLKGGHPGKYIKGNNGTYYIIYKIYLVKNRLYQIGILTKGSYPSDRDKKKFMNSFRLIEKVKKEEKSGITWELSDNGSESQPQIDSTSEGVLFTSSDKRFSILLPGTPEVSLEKVDTEVGVIEMKTILYEKSLTEAYMAAYSDYPPQMVELSDVDELLQGGKEGALESLGIDVNTLDEEKDIELNGNPGKYFKGNNEKYYVVYEMYLVNNRLYQIAILRDGSYPTQAEVDMFIGSFKLNQIATDD